MARSTALPAPVRVADAPAAARPLYHALRGLVGAVLTRAFDLTVEGLEHLPPTGPYVVAANHHNYLDGMVLGVAIPEPISFLVMPRVWRASPVHPLLHRGLGSIRLDVARPDVGALRCALDALERGRVIGIFPEGPFSVRGRLERGRPGVGLLALRSGVPVVPAGIRGTWEALTGRRFYIPRRHPLRVRFGPARRFTGDGGASPRQTRAAVTERIMADIAALLS